MPQLMPNAPNNQYRTRNTTIVPKTPPPHIQAPAPAAPVLSKPMSKTPLVNVLEYIHTGSTVKNPYYLPFIPIISGNLRLLGVDGGTKFAAPGRAMAAGLVNHYNRPRPRNSGQSEKENYMSSWKHLVMAALIAVLSIGSFSCNTVKGAGRDIQEGGEVIEDAAGSAQR